MSCVIQTDWWPEGSYSFFSWGVNTVETLSDVQTVQELCTFLETVKEKEWHRTKRDGEAFSVWHESLYTMGGKLSKEGIFKQLNCDFCRGKGRQEFLVNDRKWEKGAAALLEELLSTYEQEQEALKVMALLQQGIFADVQNEIRTAFEMPESGYDLVNYPEGMLTDYQLTLQNGMWEVYATHLFGFISINTETPLFREIPYASIRATVSVDLIQKEVQWAWKVEKIDP